MGTKHKSSIMKLLSYITQAKRQADFVNMVPYGVGNKNASKWIKSDVLQFIPTSPENIDKCVWMNSQWWAENEAKMFELWNEWMIKK